MSFSRSLKQPKLDIAWRTSVSKSFADGIMWVCMTSIIDIPKCTSPLPPAMTQGCLFISFNWKSNIFVNFCRTSVKCGRKINTCRRIYLGFVLYAYRYIIFFLMYITIIIGIIKCVHSSDKMNAEEKNQKKNNKTFFFFTEQFWIITFYSILNWITHFTVHVLNQTFFLWIY